MKIRNLTSMTLWILSSTQSIDLGSGYWQVEMKEEVKEKTDITVGNLGFYKM